METVKLAGFGRNGAVLDIAEYDAVPESFNEVRNFRFNSTGAVAFSGQRSVLAPAPINPLWLRVFPPVDFPRWVYADLQNVYIFDDGHINLSRPGGYNGVVNERWQGEVFSGVGIFNNTVDVPQMWPQFSSSTPLADLSNWPSNLRCKFLRPFKVFLMAGFLTESGNDHPFRIRWSHPADPGQVPPYWDVGNPAHDSGELELSETDDYVVDGRTLGEAFIVYKQKTAHMMYLTGNSNVFGQRTIISGKGALTRDCVQDIPGGHFVAGIDDIYFHTGQKGSEQSLVEAKVKKWIYNQIDASNFFNCYTVDYRSENEIWFCFPEAGEIYPTLAMVWNKITGGIGFRDVQGAPFMWSGPVDERTTDGDIWGGDEQAFTGTGALAISIPIVSGAGNTEASLDFETALQATGSISDGATFTADANLVFGAGDFSIEAIARRDGVPDAHLGHFIRVSVGGGDPRAYAFGLNLASVSPFNMRLQLDAVGAVQSFLSDNLSVTGWNHYAVTVNRSTNFARFYLNGTFLNQVDISAVSGVASAGTMSVVISDNFQGSLDELRVWNDVRSDGEIAANWDGEIASPGSDSSLKAYFKFNEGSGSTTADSSASGYTATLASGAGFVTGPF